MKMILATGWRTRVSGVDRRPSGAGFTLIELVLVMLLLAVVLAFAVPSLTRFTTQRTLEDETTRFLALTRFARNEAMSVGLPIVLWIDSQDQQYGIEALMGGEPREGRLFEHALHPELSLTVVEGLLSQDALIRMVFMPDGTMGEMSPVTIQLADREENRLYVTRSENGLTFEILRPSEYALRLEQRQRTTAAVPR